MNIKPGGKIIIGIIFIAIVISAKVFWWDKRPHAVEGVSLVGVVAIPDAPEASLSGSATKLAFPSTSVSGNGGTQIIHYMMEWQSQNSWVYANGGKVTTKKSLFDNVKLQVNLERQDDCAQSCANLIQFIKDYKSNPQTPGVMITFMGSGIPNYITGIATAVKDLGPEYQPIAFCTSGKSYGEDQVIGDAKYKSNPQLLKGAIVIGVRLDGDLDLMIKLCGDNNIRINPNEKYYDPEACNFRYATTFLTAVSDYNSNLKETRKVIKNGVTTGKDTLLGIDLVATWTPGDDNAINGRGGVTIISTRDYASMMPNITITCKKWLSDHRTDAVNLISALAQAGDQIRSFDDVKKYVSKLNVSVYNDQTEAFWYSHYNGIKRGNTFLGGSMVFNLADMCNMLGLKEGAMDIYKSVYNTFGTKQSKLYPKDLATFLPYEKAFDKSIIMEVMANNPLLMEGKSLKVEHSSVVTEKVSSKSVHINFETGSSIIMSSSYDELEELLQSAIVANGLTLGVYGHTDNTGNSDNNRVLSEQRALSVKNWFIEHGYKDVIQVVGYGQDQPIAENNTSQGRAQNRRVDIVLGK